MIPDLLRGAADAIDKAGWTQRRDIDPATGGLCANGALRVAAGHVVHSTVFGETRLSTPLDWSVERAQATGRQLAVAHSVLNEYLDTHDTRAISSVMLPSIMIFNDRIATTVGDVTGALRGAAAWVESHPERELAAVEESARSNYLFPQPAPVLESASV